MREKKNTKRMSRIVDGVLVFPSFLIFILAGVTYRVFVFICYNKVNLITGKLQLNFIFFFVRPTFAHARR